MPGGSRARTRIGRGTAVQDGSGLDRTPEIGANERFEPAHSRPVEGAIIRAPQKGPAHLSVSPVQPAAVSVIGQAVLRTLIYSDLFDAALTAPELQRYLGPPGIARVPLLTVLDDALPPEWLCRREGFLALAGREHLVALRQRRLGLSARRWPVARRWARRLAVLPFVRMVAVTGTLAASNVEPGDDIDYLIVTETGRLWTCRAFVIALVHLARLEGTIICPNYILSLDALALEERDLYTARELVQMVPLYGEGVYRRMRALNPWADDRFPHAAGPPPGSEWARPGAAAGALKRLLEQTLRRRAFDGLERREQRRRTARLVRLVVAGRSGARFDAACCKSHIDDHRPAILARYAASVREHGLEDAPGA